MQIDLQGFKLFLKEGSMNLKDFYPKIFKDKHPRLLIFFCFMAYCKNRNRCTYVISKLMAKARYSAKENM